MHMGFLYLISFVIFAVGLMIYTCVKIFKGKEIFITELKPQLLQFSIEKSGFYALWVHGKLFKLNPARSYPAEIWDQNKQPVRRLPFVGNVYKNGFTESKQVHRVWYLKAGQYYLNVEYQDVKLFKPSDQPNARYQLKETMPLLVTAGILIAYIAILRVFLYL